MFQKAKTLSANGHRSEATSLYRQILVDEPGHFRALNNLGGILEDEGEFDEALVCFQKANKYQPGEASILFNIAHVLYKMENMSASLDAWHELLKLDPESSEAHFGVGNILMDRKDYTTASISYMLAVDNDPENFQAVSNMGLALLEIHQPVGAEAAFARALELHPNATDYFNLAKVKELLGDVAGATANYHKSIEAQPDSALCYERLAYLLGRTGQEVEAREVIDAWLKHMPDSASALHAQAAYSDVPPKRAPNQYVAELFDKFADNFDQTLERIGYQAPSLMADELNRILPSADKRLDVLDAGCGTGLCANALRQHAVRLVGVDLSANMLERARDRQLYDALYEQELTDYVEQISAAFDVVFCCDTLVYFGELAGILAAFWQALRPGGWLFFTVELGQGQADYELGFHGRYNHSQSAINRYLSSCDFERATLQTVTLRKESGRSVEGLLVSCMRPA